MSAKDATMIAENAIMSAKAAIMSGKDATRSAPRTYPYAPVFCRNVGCCGILRFAVLRVCGSMVLQFYDFAVLRFCGSAVQRFAKARR